MSISSSEYDSELTAMSSLLTSQDYKKLLLIVSSHCVTQCIPCCVSLCAHIVSRSVSRAASSCLAPPCARPRLDLRPALITAGNGVDATRIQFQNILGELLPVHKAVPTSRACSPDRRRRMRIVLEHHFHPKALLAYHHAAYMRVQAFDSSRPLACADKHIYKQVKFTLEQTTKALGIRGIALTIF